MVDAGVELCSWFDQDGRQVKIGETSVDIAAMFGASSVTDDPLEAWLKQSLYGVASDRFIEDDETAAFNKIFELPREVKPRSAQPDWRSPAPGLGPARRWSLAAGCRSVEGFQDHYYFHSCLRLYYGRQGLI